MSVPSVMEDMEGGEQKVSSGSHAVASSAEGTSRAVDGHSIFAIL